MRRRDFIALVGSSGITWPLATRAQQAKIVAKIGFIYPGPEQVAKTRSVPFLAGLASEGVREPENLVLIIRTTGGDMAKAFGFSEDELKMLLVAVRQMRRTFAAAQKTAPEPQPAVEAYARLYDDLYEKLLDMTGPVPPEIEEVL